LGKVLQSPQSVPSPQSLVRSQTLFELDDLPEEQACLVILFLLTALRETFKTLPPGGKGLRCVILLDEAHVVIGRQDQASPSEEFADPKSFATEYFGRMMRELRALRVGLVIADQNASSLAASVLKNACSHLAYRQTAAEDHALLASAMLLSEADCEDLARLEPGEAFFMTEGFYGPRRIRTVHLQRELGECVAPTDAELLEIISKEEWWLEAARERLGCDLMLLSEKLAGLGARLKTWMERAASLRERLAQASGMEDRRAWVKAGKAITASMSQELDRFRRESYRPLLGEDIPGALSALAEIMTHRDTIKQRFEEVMEPAAKSVIRTVEKMAA
ncbi:MAG: hypothetical protein NTW86_09820, partial [Candidatus Sumerlaeota bacterium]|nr:hypothetical protein [Candidatus Sumerlaeota bacterium]